MGTQARRLAEKDRSPSFRAAHTTCHLFGHDFEAQGHAKELVALAIEHGFPFWVAKGTVELG